jgi:LuxR family quorum sensing-dependent transcriptional regulator
MPSKLAADILNYTDQVPDFHTSEHILDALDIIASEHCKLHVLGAGLMPVEFKRGTDGYELGKTVFLHRSVPKGWWEDYLRMTTLRPAPAMIMARLAIGPYTLSELLNVLEPIGIDRWAIDLHQRYGIRDLMGVPIGGRWVFAFWARKLIKIAPEERALLFLGGTYATIRLQKLVQPTPARIPKGAALTARELSVLRALSLGERPREVAKHLGLGEETVRTHIKKAQLKLGVETPGAAIASAIRLHLIP